MSAGQPWAHPWELPDPDSPPHRLLTQVLLLSEPPGQLRPLSLPDAHPGMSLGLGGPRVASRAAGLSGWSGPPWSGESCGSSASSPKPAGFWFHDWLLELPLGSV